MHSPMPYTVFGDYHMPGCGINNTSSHQAITSRAQTEHLFEFLPVASKGSRVETRDVNICL